MSLALTAVVVKARAAVERAVGDPTERRAEAADRLLETRSAMAKGQLAAVATELAASLTKLRLLAWCRCFVPYAPFKDT